MPVLFEIETRDIMVKCQLSYSNKADLSKKV